MGFSSLHTAVISIVGQILFSFELTYYARLIDYLPSLKCIFL